jgi:beta-glucosidase
MFSRLKLSHRCHILTTSFFLLCTVGAKAQFVGNDPAAVEKRVDSLLQQMTLDEKIDLISGDTPFRTHAIPRLNIPFFQMADGPVGAHIPAPTIAYAGGIGLAATWNPELAKGVGEQLGRDSRSRGAAFILGPGVNIYRMPLNGRNFEYFGEDPFLGSSIAVGYIRGVQEEGVSATVKHYLGNNSEYLRHDSDSIIDERTLREIYMPIFESAVKQGHVGAIMDAYNLTNGEHMTQNKHLNVDVAKGDWNFRGLIMSDWVSTYDAMGMANGGLDLEMPFGFYFNRETLLPLIKSGAITEATIDDKVRRILRVAVDFGWLDHPQMDISIPRYNLQGRAVALQGALEGAVLLKNDEQTLPLRKDTLHTIAVIGPTAAQTVTTGGGSGEVVSYASTNLLTGLSSALGEHADVLYARGLYSTSQLARLTRFAVDPDGKTPGALHDIYDNKTLSGTPVSSTTERVMVTPGSTRRDPEEQELNALTTHRSSNPYTASGASGRWTGYFTPEQPGPHVVFVQTDGKYRLLVDDKVVIDSSVIPKYILSQVTLDLTAGPHKVVLEQLSQQLGSVSGVRVGIAALKTIVDPAALAIARKADAVVLAVGFNNTSESEGGDRSFELPVGQNQLIQEIADQDKQLGKKTIVVITSGGAVDILPWMDKVQGIFATWYSGEEGGDAIARLLLGDANPSGHLPISWDAKLTDNPSFSSYYPDPGTDKIFYREGIFVGYRGYEHTHTKPLFPFGYGLSYSTFHFSNLTTSAEQNGTFQISFDATNDSSIAGATVAQLYVGERKPTVDRPTKELKGFARVALGPNETRHVTINLNPRSFAFFDVKTHQWLANAGEYQLSLGQSSEQIDQKIEIKLNAPLHIAVSE